MNLIAHRLLTYLKECDFRKVFKPHQLYHTPKDLCAYFRREYRHLNLRSIFVFVPFSNIQRKECQNWFKYLKMRQI